MFKSYWTTLLLLIVFSKLKMKNKYIQVYGYKKWNVGGVKCALEKITSNKYCINIKTRFFKNQKKKNR